MSLVLGKSKRIYGGNGWIPCYDQLTFFTVYFSLITRIDLISLEKKNVYLVYRFVENSQSLLL